MKRLKIIGLTISISFIMFIALALLVKSLGIIFEGFFNKNALVIAIVSGSIILIGLITGAISLGAMKGRSLF